MNKFGFLLERLHLLPNGIHLWRLWEAGVEVWVAWARRSPRLETAPPLGQGSRGSGQLATRVLCRALSPRAASGKAASFLSPQAGGGYLLHGGGSHPPQLSLSSTNAILPQNSTTGWFVRHFTAHCFHLSVNASDRSGLLNSLGQTIGIWRIYSLVFGEIFDQIETVGGPKQYQHVTSLSNCKPMSGQTWTWNSIAFASHLPLASSRNQYSDKQ